ncbi:hypothetical protein PJL11_28615, partial [Mycobacterium kansasii]
MRSDSEPRESDTVGLIRLLKGGTKSQDFRNLNLTTPKDEYPMPIVDLLVDSSAGHMILSMMDGHSGYNQICIAEEDV